VRSEPNQKKVGDYFSHNFSFICIANFANLEESVNGEMPYTALVKERKNYLIIIITSGTILKWILER
jgi:hypothetical protein